MLSRVAENLYWVGRYVERAENTARVVNVNANLLLDLPRGIARGWEPLIAITGGAEIFEQQHETHDERSVVRFLVGEPANPGSIISSLSMARENCRTIRDTVPREAWELINELFLFAKDDLASGLSKRGRYAYLRRVIHDAQTLAGMLLGTMNHDAGHAFLRVGRVLERGDMTTRIVDVRSATLLPEERSGLLPFENIQWMSVLKSLSAYQMYRRKMQIRVRRADALRFLLQDDEFPRAFYRCIHVVDSEISALPHGDGVRRVLARLMRAAQTADVVQLAESNAELHAFVDRLQIGLAEVHNEISRTYFLADLPGEGGGPE